MQGVPARERDRHPVHDELRIVRPEHSVSPVLPAAGRLPRHSGDLLERGQLRSGTESVAVDTAAAAGAQHRTSGSPPPVEWILR